MLIAPSTEAQRGYPYLNEASSVLGGVRHQSLGCPDSACRTEQVLKFRIFNMVAPHKFEVRRASASNPAVGYPLKQLLSTVCRILGQIPELPGVSRSEGAIVKVPIFKLAPPRKFNFSLPSVR